MSTARPVLRLARRPRNCEVPLHPARLVLNSTPSYLTPQTDSPQLTESDVRRWSGERSFERGRRYFQHGHILNPRLQGDTLKALVEELTAVRLTQYPDRLRLTVTDDGRGIAGGVEPARFVAQGHFGLAGMRERAAMIGGKLDVQTAADYGTVVILELLG